MESVIDMLKPYQILINILRFTDEDFEYKTQTMSLSELFNTYKHLMTEEQIKSFKELENK